MRTYSHLALSLGQELKGRFPLIKRCRVFCGYKLPDKDKTDLKLLLRLFFVVFFKRKSYYRT